MLRKLQYFFKRNAPPNIFLRDLRSKYIRNISIAETNWALLLDLLKIKTIFYIVVFIVKKMADK